MASSSVRAHPLASILLSLHIDGGVWPTASDDDRQARLSADLLGQLRRLGGYALLPLSCYRLAVKDPGSRCRVSCMHHVPFYDLDVTATETHLDELHCGRCMTLTAAAGEGSERCWRPSSKLCWVSAG